MSEAQHGALTHERLLLLHDQVINTHDGSTRDHRQERNSLCTRTFSGNLKSAEGLQTELNISAQLFKKRNLWFGLLKSTSSQMRNVLRLKSERRSRSQSRITELQMLCCYIITGYVQIKQTERWYGDTSPLKLLLYSGILNTTRCVNCLAKCIWQM